MIQWGDPGLTAVFAGAFLSLLTLVWGLLLVGVGRWGEAWRLDPEPPAPSGRLSICIPARNEAGRIGPCVRAALASDHPDLEVIVVDDKSDDGTGEEAAAAAEGDPRLRVVQGSEPPAGWSGKAWACMRAAGEADGAQLLFIDADVVLAPDAARRAAGVLQSAELSMLSLFGSWQLESFWERAVIPVVGWFIRGSVDLDAVNDPGRPEAFANGQFILVGRDAYDRLEGHRVVRAEVLDDVRLARAMKARAMPIGLRYAPEAFHVRLYENLGQIVQGYGKNLYEGMDRRPLVGVGAIGFVFISTLLPFALLTGVPLLNLLMSWSLGSLGWGLWLAGICAMVLLFRFRLERADDRSGWHALSHPIGNLIFVFILLRAVFGVEAVWKGRRFVDGKASSTD